MAKNQKLKLHLGCGPVILPGYVNVDHIKMPGVDVVMDLEHPPYPFKDNSVDEVYARHTFEHIENLLPMMEELHRICAPGAKIRITVPYFASPAYARDPTHKRKFNIDTFAFFSEVSPYSPMAFTVVKRRLNFFSSTGFMKSSWYSWPIDAIINLTKPVYQRFFVYYLPCSEVHFLLEVKKDGPASQKKKKK